MSCRSPRNLKVVSAQDVEDDGQGGVRIAQGVAPERVISVVDPEARHGHRSRRDRYDGYKLHVSVDAVLPGTEPFGN